MALHEELSLYEKFYLEHFGRSEEQVEAILNQKYQDEYHVEDRGTILVKALRLAATYVVCVKGDYIKCENQALLSVIKEMLK